MRMIAMETSGRDASLAALVVGDDGATQLVGEAAVAGPERTAQFLAPRLNELLQSVAWAANTIQLVSVAVGPGSFTGLRIGVTTAKTLAYAVGAEVIGVNSLAVIASQAPPGPEPIWAMMDAQRQELFAARFDGGRMIGDTVVVPQLQFLKMLSPGDRVTGPGLTRLRNTLSGQVTIVDPTLWQPMAASLGALAWRDYQAGRRDDLWQLMPEYYRKSAAEEKRDKEIG